MRSSPNAEPGASPKPPAPEWRRLLLALAFFLACLGLFVGLVAIGFYH